jgi:rhodanese-related sulfurtransferase
LKPLATTTTTAQVAKPATGNRQPATEAAPAPTPAKPDISKFTPHPDKTYIEIAYADVAALHAGGALFLDARRTSVYEQGHIAGARSFSVWEADIDDKVNKLFNERSGETDQAKPIVAYCSGGECEDSHMLAQKLWGIQFNNVYVYKDGFPDWQKHGGAVHTGPTP